MKVYEALESLNYKLLGHGSDFVIVNQDTFESIRNKIAGYVTLKPINSLRHKQVYLIQYDTQSEGSIVNKLITIADIYCLVIEHIDSSIKFNMEHSSIEILNNETKDFLQDIIEWSNLCDGVHIEFIQDKLLWEMAVKKEEVQNLFKALQDSIKSRSFLRNYIYTISSHSTEIITILIIMQLCLFVINKVFFK